MRSAPFSPTSRADEYVFVPRLSYNRVVRHLIARVQDEGTYRADTEVDTLQVLYTVHVQAGVDNTTLLTGLHRTRAERVPRRLDVVRNPVVDRLVVLLGVLEVLMDLARVVRLGGAVPGAHVDAHSEAVGVDLLRGADVDVLARRRGGRVEVRVVRGELTAEGCEGGSR